MKVVRLCLLLACCGTSSASLFAQDFRPLFNGRDLAGWVEMGRPGGFVVEDRILFLKEPRNYPNWLRTEKEYENFILKLEYMTAGWCETGIFLHAPLCGDPARTGLRLHLRHDSIDEGSRSTGGIYDAVPPITIANKPAKEWNALEIRMDWPALRITLNGSVIHDLNLEQSEILRDRLRRGYIGFDDLNCAMRYRNIEISELPDKDREWTSLFNGKDLKGWVPEGKAHWGVEEGHLAGSNGDGYLFTEDMFDSFEFQVCFRSSPQANGGVFFRHSPVFRGYEIQIYNVPGATNPTGSIYGIAGANDVLCRDGDWCHLRFISDGAFAAAWVNGRRVAETYGLVQPQHGNLGFQNHSDGKVEYIAPKIRRLR